MMARPVTLVLVTTMASIALVACATEGSLTFVVVRPHIQGDLGSAHPPDSAAGPQIVSEARRLTSEEIRKRFPKEILVEGDSSAPDAVAGMLEGEREFFEGNVDRGTVLLREAWSTVSGQPEILPSDPQRRRQLYGAILLVFRLLMEEGQGLESEISSWLATHMPEQSPSVRVLPPEMEAAASEALDATRQRHVPLSVRGPRPGTGCHWTMDGLVLGEPPLTGVTIPPGLHVFVPVCGETRGWSRRVDVAEGGVRLWARDIQAEHRLRRTGEGLTWAGELEAPELRLAGRSLATSLMVDGVVFLPTQPDQDVWLSTPYGERRLQKEEDGWPLRTRFLEPPRTWKWAAAWLLLGTGVGIGAGGGLWHWQYMEAARDVHSGRRDRRDDMDSSRTKSIGLYATAGALVVSSGVLFLLEALSKPSPAPSLFPVVEYHR